MSMRGYHGQADLEESGHLAWEARMGAALAHFRRLSEPEVIASTACRVHGVAAGRPCSVSYWGDTEQPVCCIDRHERAAFEAAGIEPAAP